MLAAHAPTPGPSNSTIECRDLCSLAVSPASFDSSRFIRLQLYTMYKRGGQRGPRPSVPNKEPLDRWSPTRGSLAGPPVTRLSLLRTDFPGSLKLLVRRGTRSRKDSTLELGLVRGRSAARARRNLKRRGERIPHCCHQGSKFDSSNARSLVVWCVAAGRVEKAGESRGIRLAANALVVFVVG